MAEEAIVSAEHFLYTEGVVSSNLTTPSLYFYFIHGDLGYPGRPLVLNE